MILSEEIKINKKESIIIFDNSYYLFYNDNLIEKNIFDSYDDIYNHLIKRFNFDLDQYINEINLKEREKI